MNYKLHKIDMPLYSIATSVYLVETERSVFVIDAGVLSGRDMLDKALTDAGAASKKLYLLLTHDHWDHTGLAGYLKDLGATVFAHASAEKLLNADMDMLCRSGYEQYIGDFPTTPEKLKSVRELASDPCPADVYLTDGSHITDGIVDFEIIHTPGHWGSSSCYYEKMSGAVFSGDSIQGSGYYGGPLQLTDAAAYEASLKKLSAYSFSAIYGGHEGAVGVEESAQYLKLSADTNTKVAETVKTAFLEADRFTVRLTDLARDVARRLDLPFTSPLFGLVSTHLRKYLS